MNANRAIDCMYRDGYSLDAILNDIASGLNTLVDDRGGIRKHGVMSLLREEEKKDNLPNCLRAISRLMTSIGGTQLATIMAICGAAANKAHTKNLDNDDDLLKAQCAAALMKETEGAFATFVAATARTDLGTTFLMQSDSDVGVFGPWAIFFALAAHCTSSQSGDNRPGGLGLSPQQANSLCSLIKEKLMKPVCGKATPHPEEVKDFIRDMTRVLEDDIVDDLHDKMKS